MRVRVGVRVKVVRVTAEGSEDESEDESEDRSEGGNVWEWG